MPGISIGIMMSFMETKTTALLIFITAYILFVFLPKKRTPIAVTGALLLVLLGVMSPLQAFFAINWNVMGIFVRDADSGGYLYGKPGSCLYR